MSKEDLAELSDTATPDVESSNIDDTSEENISLEEVSEAENQVSEKNSDNSEENN